jgi:hypothetical protein
VQSAHALYTKRQSLAAIELTAPSVEGRVLVERGASVPGAQTLAHVQAA